MTPSFLGRCRIRENLTSLVGRLTGRLVEALTCDFVLVKARQRLCDIPKSQQSIGLGSTAWKPRDRHASGERAKPRRAASAR